MDNDNHLSGSERVYASAGNEPLVTLLNHTVERVLDIGCGTGGNAVLIKSLYPDSKIYGITHSTSEADIARHYMNHCWVADIECELPLDLEAERFDTLIFSHVLEHMRDPAMVLSRFVNLLEQGGQVLIAVPNILSWRMRTQFLLGNFEYQSGGVLDETHLRFFTYFSIDQLLLSPIPELELVNKTASGNVPLWLLRRYVFPERWSNRIDEWGCKHWPNLFGWQIVLKAVKK